VIDANRIAGPLPPPVAFGEMRVEGDRGAVSMAGDGDLRLIEYDAGERAHEFEKPSIGYKGDSVRAMQQHFVDCMRSGAKAESEGEDYLRTATLVEACYRSAAKGAVEVVV
jgi:predicted dehydrogenase